MHAVQVRAAFISEDGHAETKKLAKHSGRAHKLALEPDQPHCFLSSGEDGASAAAVPKPNASNEIGLL